jgi:hypothetical protein
VQQNQASVCALAGLLGNGFVVTTFGGFNQRLQGVAILTGVHPAMMASSLQPLAFNQLEGLRCRASCGHRPLANVSTRACKVFGSFTQSLQVSRC